MSNDADLMKLYSKRILALASDMPFTDRLENPDGTARKRSPLCGSTVTVDIALNDGLISQYGQDVKACALGQAAASVVGQGIIGLSHSNIKSLQNELRAMLKESGPIPAAPFDGFEVLLPARDYKNRHASIMLTLDAIDAAFEEAAQTSPAEKSTA